MADWTTKNYSLAICNRYGMRKERLIYNSNLKNFFCILIKLSDFLHTIWNYFQIINKCIVNNINALFLRFINLKKKIIATIPKWRCLKKDCKGAAKPELEVVLTKTTAYANHFSLVNFKVSYIFNVALKKTLKYVLLSFF